MIDDHLAEYFETTQAFALAHALVRTKRAFYLIPAGTHGRITGVAPSNYGLNLVEVTWDSTPPVKETISKREFTEYLELLPS
jgi:hypothetical protein